MVHDYGLCQLLMVLVELLHFILGRLFSSNASEEIRRK